LSTLNSSSMLTAKGLDAIFNIS